MIKQVILTRVHKADKDKNGKQYGFTRGGKFIPSKRIAIKFDGDDNWYSDFMQDGDVREAWQEGMKVTIVAYKKGDFYNFREPSRLDYLEARVEAIEKKLGIGEQETKEEITEDIPF